MKKFTKVLSVVLCLALFCGIALGSGSSSSEETKKVVAKDEDDANETEEEVTETTSEEISIEEQVIFDEAGITITAKEYDTTGFMGDGIKLLIQNTSDRNVTVGCTALIVNHYMIDDLFATTVAAGMNANETLYLSSNELEAAGIDVVGLIEVYLHVYDADSWEDIYNSDCIEIRTSQYDKMDTTPNDSGYELYNEGGIRIVGKTVDENSFWGTAILLYIENNTGRNICVQVQNMAINGFMVSPVFSCDVYDGRMAIDDITIFSSDLEDNGIETIEEVSISFHIFDADSWDGIVDTEPITFAAS